MKEKIFDVGDKVELKTKDKIWIGWILESYDSSIVLLKLDSGYNIGIREEEILNAKVIEKYKEDKKEKKNLEVKKGLKNVAMIITGGTISSRLDAKTGGVISTDADEILNIAPEVKDICNIVKIEKPFMKWSENMDFKDWKKLAESVEKLLNDDKVDGIIVTHGTDFLHYSAAALNFYLGKLNKPVALTYSQRSIDRGSSDAHLNLICACKYAVSDIAEVSIIGHRDLDDRYCLAMPGVKTRKLHSSRRDAFKVVNDSAIAEISKNDFKILKEFNARNNKKVKLDTKFSDKVGVVKIYPGQKPEILDFYFNKGYKGLIIELTGLGHVISEGKNSWVGKIKSLINKGMVICGVAQTIYGRLDSSVYSAGRELKKTGLIFLNDMLSETAFVKLSWVLGHSSWKKDKDKVREKMLENISGEFNSKLGFE